jgi:hypothetical protein
MKAIVRLGYAIHYLGRTWKNEDGIIDLSEEIYKSKEWIFEPEAFVKGKLANKDVKKDTIKNKAILDSEGEVVTKRRL